MGIKNYLIDGVSCAGKTSVCYELRRRGYQAIDGDNELAYWGEDRTWIWSLEKVSVFLADPSHAITFFCGGSRNSDDFIARLDGAFLLEIDGETLDRRLAARPKDEWGGTASEGETFARRQHATREGLPRNAMIIDATLPLSSVVDTILERADVT